MDCVDPSGNLIRTSTYNHDENDRKTVIEK